MNPDPPPEFRNRQGAYMDISEEAKNIERDKLAEKESAAKNSALVSILRSRLYRNNIITLSHLSTGDRLEVKQAIIRLNFECGQDCGFCYNVIRPRVTPEDAEWAIARLLKAFDSIEVLSFSGGEPGLCRQLEKYIKMAKDGPALRVDIQTNAMPFADGQLARKVAAAGLDSALASLHAHEPALGDAITKTPGAYNKTIRGIRNLIEAGVTVHINHVINPLNQAHITDFAQTAARLFPGALICFSVAQPFIFFPPDRMKHIPRYSEFAPRLAEALDWCLENGVGFSGLHEACGLPLCVLGADKRYFKTFHNVSEQKDAASAPEDIEFFKPDKCRPCAARNRCFGVRRKYAEYFGVDELNPVEDV